MCTLTVVPLPAGRVRAAFNRDESRTRPPARPPRVWDADSRRAVYPIDPQSDGTWLAVNDAGLVLAVLNVTPPDRVPPPADARSRGLVIPALLGCDTPADAVAAAERFIDYPRFAPFRLVLVGSGVVADVRWDGTRPMGMSRLLGGTPRLFTSSGLGDHLVDEVRRELFDAAFAGPPAGWSAAQDDFHRQTLPDRPHLAVNMSRASARTVSHAVVTLADAGAEFAYWPDAPDRPAEPVTVLLPYALAGAA